VIYVYQDNAVLYGSYKAVTPELVIDAFRKDAGNLSRLFVMRFVVLTDVPAQ
jgi:hypothetical protein